MNAAVVPPELFNLDCCARGAWKQELWHEIEQYSCLLHLVRRKGYSCAEGKRRGCDGDRFGGRRGNCKSIC